MTDPRDADATTKPGEIKRLVADGIESTERCADLNPNLETDTGPHLLVYRERVTNGPPRPGRSVDDPAR